MPGIDCDYARPPAGFAELGRAPSGPDRRCGTRELAAMAGRKQITAPAADREQHPPGDRVVPHAPVPPRRRLRDRSVRRYRPDLSSKRGRLIPAPGRSRRPASGPDGRAGPFPTAAAGPGPEPRQNVGDPEPRPALAKGFAAQRRHAMILIGSDPVCHARPVDAEWRTRLFRGPAIDQYTLYGQPSRCRRETARWIQLFRISCIHTGFLTKRRDGRSRPEAYPRSAPILSLSPPRRQSGRAPRRRGSGGQDGTSASGAVSIIRSSLSSGRSRASRSQA